ncbi:MAG: hypothetical protein ONA90_07745 [candidate division KSB1 bacterium]|nr:hypothetical protein [candidate division KSB1 bacterium]
MQRKTNCNEREWVDLKELSPPTNGVCSCFQIDLMKPAILKAFCIAVLFSLQNLGTNFFQKAMRERGMAEKYLGSDQATMSIFDENQLAYFAIHFLSWLLNCFARNGLAVLKN